MLGQLEVEELAEAGKTTPWYWSLRVWKIGLSLAATLMFLSLGVVFVTTAPSKVRLKP